MNRLSVPKALPEELELLAIAHAKYGDRCIEVLEEACRLAEAEEKSGSGGCASPSRIAKKLPVASNAPKTRKAFRSRLLRGALRVSCITALMLSLAATSPESARGQTSPPTIPMEWFGFQTPDFLTDFQSAPLFYTTNLLSVPVGILWGLDNALILDTTNLDPACLEYAVQDTNGINNFSYDPGTVLFYYAPNWASVSTGGLGPSETAYFLGSGDWSPGSPNGLFTVYADAYGSNIYVAGVAAGVTNIYASAPISWPSNTFHQIGVEWSSQGHRGKPGIKLYLDGALAATGIKLTNVPAMGYDSNGFCTNGLFVGSDNNGGEQMRGTMYNLISWGTMYGGWYCGGWPYMSNALAAWQAASGGADFGTMMGMGVGMAMEAAPGYLDGATYTTNYADYTNFRLAIGTPASASQLTIQNTQSNLTYQILTNSVMDPNLGNWNVWQTLVASNSVIVPPPLNPGSNALFLDAALVWSTTTNGLPDWYEMEYFGNLNQPANGYYDGGTLNNGDAYTNGIDPNIITFTISCTNQNVNLTSVPLSLGIHRGVPYNWAVTLDNTNFGAASWTPYTSSNITANLGTVEGWHTVWVGLRGLPANAQQTWNAVALNLSLTPPTLVITNPLASTVTVQVIQLQGFCPEPLSSISYDLLNGSGLVTNRQVLVVDQFYDTTTWAFTTNTFQALDVPLTQGLNTFTLHATDLAGNVTVTNFTFTLDYSSKTNPPAVQIAWPSDGALVSGTNFTCRGWISDPTASISASMCFTNGDTNVFPGGLYTNFYSGVVDREGDFWLENLALEEGTNILEITVMDAATNSTLETLHIVQSALQLSVYPVDPDSQLWHPTVGLSGEISDATCSVWVNGVQATCDGYGDWSAEAAPVNVGGGAIFDITAYGPGETVPSAAISFSQSRPSRVYVAKYSEFHTFWLDERYTNTPTSGTWWNYFYAATNTITWTDGGTGVKSETNLLQLICYRSDLNYTNLNSAFTYWPVSSWPNIPYGDCLDYYNDVYATETFNGTNTYTNFVSPIAVEHCSILVPSPDVSGTYIGGSSSSVTAFAKGSRHEQPTIKIQTGGPPGSTNLSLFVISTTATNMPIIEAPPPDWDQVNGPPTPIWPTNIMIGAFGYLGADGKLYVVLPDNTQIDITPTVPGLPYITFGDTNGNPVSAMKYTPTIQVMTNGAAPLTLDAGGAFKFCVGQSLQFTATWNPPLPGDPPILPIWTFSGQFVNESNYPVSEDWYNWGVDMSLLNYNPHPTVWYVSGGTNSATIEQTIPFTNGQYARLNTTAQFTVVKPTVNMINAAVHGPPTLLWNPPWNSAGWGGISLGIGPNDNHIPNTNDISYQVQVVSPDFRGYANIVQLCTLSGTLILPIPYGPVAGFCDGSDPYNTNTVQVYTNPVNFDGSPSSLVVLEDAPSMAWFSQLSYTGQFVDTVMFSPRGSNNIYVPVGTVLWNFSFGATCPNTNFTTNIVNPPTRAYNSAIWPTYEFIYQP